MNNDLKALISLVIAFFIMLMIDTYSLRLRIADTVIVKKTGYIEYGKNYIELKAFEPSDLSVISCRVKAGKFPALKKNDNVKIIYTINRISRITGCIEITIRNIDEG